MLVIPTTLGKSPIHGMGCFASVKIRKGDVVWKFEKTLDAFVDRESATVHQNLISYCSPSGKLVVCGDNAAAINFSTEPNLKFGNFAIYGEKDLIAARDIEAGEELTVGIETDADAERKLRLQPLIQDFLDAIGSAVYDTTEGKEEECRPVIYFSGGKDSMVLLHLAITRGPMMPLILHREPWKTHKYAFAESIIRDWNLKAFDYPPSKVNLWHGKGIVAFTNFYQIADFPKFLALPKNIIESDAPSALCARYDILSRPTGTFKYPWNLMLVGHKSSDVDQIAGAVPLKTSFVDNGEGNPNVCFPLAEWTDSDVWDYIEQFAVPFQEDRYANRSEIADKTQNSDYFEACIRCVDRRNEDKEVDCPRLGKKIANVSHLVEYQDLRPSYIMPEPATSI